MQSRLLAGTDELEKDFRKMLGEGRRHPYSDGMGGNGLYRLRLLSSSAFR